MKIPTNGTGNVGETKEIEEWRQRNGDRGSTGDRLEGDQ